MTAALLLAVLALAGAAGPPALPSGLTPREAAKWLMLHGDIGELGVHADANRALIAAGDRRQRVVLLGDSITFRWPAAALPELGSARLVNRGIPGQNTAQMLLRFEDDVVALGPAAVVILAGTNDLRTFGRPAPGDAATRQIMRNVTAMADIADARRIRVILCAIPPVGASQAGGSRDPAAIVAANEWLRGFAAARGYRFIDYHGALVGRDGLLPAAYTSDGLHLTPAAYRKLESLLREALRSSLDR